MGGRGGGRHSLHAEASLISSASVPGDQEHNPKHWDERPEVGPPDDEAFRRVYGAVAHDHCGDGVGANRPAGYDQTRPRQDAFGGDDDNAAKRVAQGQQDVTEDVPCPGKICSGATSWPGSGEDCCQAAWVGRGDERLR